jgi:hypothetical protein
MVAVKIIFVEQRYKKAISTISSPADAAAITPWRIASIYVRTVTALRRSMTFLKSLVTSAWSGKRKRKHRNFGLGGSSGW